MTIFLRPEAESDLRDAYEYYETADEGLGDAFLRAVEACLAGVERSPEQYAIIHRNVRRALVRRFPYGIFYIVENTQVIVLACFHARRDPKVWQECV